MLFGMVSDVGGLTCNVITCHMSQFLANNLAIFKYC